MTKQDTFFQDKVVIITGASRGIGAALARALAAEGCHVALAARSQEKLERLAEEVRAAYGVRAVAIPTDMADEAQVRAMVVGAAANLGRVDILINNAGMGIFGEMADLRLEDLRYVFEVNFFGALAAMQAVTPIMRRQGGGVIVNVSSIVSKFTQPLGGGYSATKFALNAASNAARVELKQDGIHVLTVCPGLTDTEFAAHTRVSVPGASRERGERQAPVRGIPPERVARRTLKAIRRREREIYITWYDRLLVTGALAAPGLFDRLLQVVVWYRRRRFGR